MHIGKSVQESLDGALVQCFRTLINLEDFLVALHIVTADGERNHELDAIGLAETCKRSHLLGIKRTEDGYHMYWHPPAARWCGYQHLSARSMHGHQ